MNFSYIKGTAETGSRILKHVNNFKTVFRTNCYLRA